MEMVDQTKSAAEARDFDEYKRLRDKRSAQAEAVVRDKRSPAPQPAVKSADSPADGDNSASPADGDNSASPADGDNSVSGPNGESVSDSEPEAKYQERREKRQQVVNARISDLTKRLKTAEEGRAVLERELEELRKGVRSPEAPPARTEAPKPAESEGEPDFEALLDTAINDPANTTYEKAQAAALRAYHKAIREAEGKRAERERTESQAKTAHEARLVKTRERHGDFDEVVAAAIPQVEGVHNPGIEAAMAASDSAEVVYYFATHLDEFRRIAQMTPQAAYRATVALDLKLSQSTPERTASAPRQATRAPAPVTPVTGATAHTPKNPAEARDYAEYKRLRNTGRN
jgi:hypothetical protein